jgi:hypothetical protein
MWVSDNPNNNQPGVHSGSVTRFTVASSFATKDVVLTSSTLYGPGQIVFDPSNNMYLAEDNNNSVVKFNYSGSCAFGYIASDSYPLSTSVPSAEAVARDSSGNLFLTAYASGVQANSKVVEISPGAATFPDTLVGSTSSTNVTVNFNVVSGTTIGSFAVLDQGVSGLEFNRVTDASADCTTGTYSSATACSIKASFTPSSPGIHYGAIMVLDGSSTVLAKAYLSGKGLGPLAAFLPGTPSTVGSGLNAPQGVYADGAGNVYIANTNGNSVIKVPFSGGAYGTQILLTTNTSFPGGVAVDGAGNVYVADYGNNQVDLIPWNGSSYGTQTTVGSGLSSPNSVAVDGSGNVYVADEGNSRIVKIPWNASTATFGTQSAIGSGWNSPTGVAVDAAGNVYVAEFYTHKVYQLPVSGTSYGSVVDIGSGWSRPFNVSVDSNGDVYVADSGTNEVSMVAWNGSSFGTQTVVASITATGLDGATGVSVDGLGNIYIADQNNDRIVKLSDSTGAALTFLTSTEVGSLDSVDGTKTVTMLNLGNTTLNIASASFPTSFSESTSTCTLSSGTLPRGANCTIGVQFTPQSAGTNSGNLVITDNHLNVTGSTQNVALSGTGVATVTQLAYITPPAATVTAGGSAGTSITVAEENASGTTATSATDTITITVTGPNGYSKTYMATAVNGVATFNLSSALLTTASGYTYTASVSATPTIANAVAAETVSATAAATVTVNTGSAQSIQIAGTFATALNVTVTDTYSNPVSGATVTFSVPSSGASATLSSTSVTTSSTGTASVTATANTIAGNYTVTASVGSPAVTASFTLTNLLATPTVVVTSSANPVFVITSVTYTAKVTGLTGVTPAGTVTFYDGTTSLGTATLSSAGVAALSAAPQVVGTNSITAVYAGSTSYNSATSSALAELAQDFSIAVASGSASSIDVLPGGTATFNLVITPLSGNTFPAPITLTQTGGPTSTTAALSTASIASGASATSFTLNVATISAPISNNRAPAFGGRATAVAFALLLMPLAGMRRFRKKWMRRLMALVLLVGGLTSMAALSGCSFGSGYFGQAPATYTYTVTGTAGSLTHSTSVTLNLK